MRLLKRSADGCLELTQHFIDDIPPYAILSHTWGANNQEVTFYDLQNGTGQNKAGYQKLTFCANQAKANSLDYFWVDTCCIDKSNNTELSESINSMFRWYMNAERCYVYLTDVQSADGDYKDNNNNNNNNSAEDKGRRATWKIDFRRSRWMTRGWTLQELIAPRSVEFFSEEGTKLGDKSSLEVLLHETTGISVGALRGTAMADLSINERFSWLETRKTTREEDRAYCMFGIFDVQLPILYSEGEEKAMQRLRREIGRDKISETGKRCIADLRVTDPRDDKTRIEDTKGGLLADSYIWVLENQDFCKWRDTESAQLLWVKGDPGKGKTMLLCGIINHLQTLPVPRVKKRPLLAYFFCQATTENINSATAVVRSLIFMLLQQDLRLLSHIEEKYNVNGKALFEDNNAWHALYKILIDMLQDHRLDGVTLAIDALDECETGRDQLLNLIVETSSFSCGVKWIVSSRNWEQIKEGLSAVAQTLSLEINADAVGAAIESYINHKLDRLTKKKSYKPEVAKTIHEYLSSEADGTFLWVSLILQELETTPKWRALEKAKSFPPGLDALYEKMLENTQATEDSKLCTKILALIATAFVPLSLIELTAVIEEFQDMADDLESLQEVITLCGSFLTVRQGTVYFVHQSAKDFLINKNAAVIFPDTQSAVHGEIFRTSVDVMTSVIHRDMYGLAESGIRIEDIRIPDDDPLGRVKYSCIYWIEHLMKASQGSEANIASIAVQHELASNFLRSKSLYWIESLSLIRCLSEGMRSLERLTEYHSSTKLIEISREIYRLLQSSKSYIEDMPLQTYASALVFSPTRSLVRALFLHEQPPWVKCFLGVEEHWPACEMILSPPHMIAGIDSAALSSDGQRVVICSHNKEAQIWNTKSMNCELALGSPKGNQNFAIFSLDGKRIISESNCNVKVWDARSGACEMTLQSKVGRVIMVILSQDNRYVAVLGIGNLDEENLHCAEVWDMTRGTRTTILSAHHKPITAASFSADGQHFLIGTGKGDVNVWDLSTSLCVDSLRFTNGSKSSPSEPVGSMLGNGARVRQVEVDQNRIVQCFSPDGRYLILASQVRGSLEVWDLAKGACRAQLLGHDKPPHCASFSADNGRIVSASWDGTLKIWNAATGECQATFRTNYPKNCAFSADGSRIISVHPIAVRFWNAFANTASSKSARHTGIITSLIFSPDGASLVSTSDDKAIKLWDFEARTRELTLDVEGRDTFVGFSADGQRIVSCSGLRDDRYQRKGVQFKIWNCATGFCEVTWSSDDIVDLAFFSCDGQRMISVSTNDICRLWDITSTTCLASHKTPESSNMFYNIRAKKAHCLDGSDGFLLDWRPYLGQPPSSGDVSFSEYNNLCTKSGHTLRLPTDNWLSQMTTFENRTGTNVVIWSMRGQMCFLHFPTRW